MVPHLPVRRPLDTIQHLEHGPDDDVEAGFLAHLARHRQLPDRLVRALEVFEHMPDPEACLVEIDRVLKRDGRLLLTVPFVAPLHQMPFDYMRFTPPGLEALLARHGFAITAMQARGNFASVVGSTSAHWILRTFGSAGAHQDGSFKLSRWRAPLLSPLVALLQLGASFFERWSDDTSTLGYAVVAERR